MSWWECCGVSLWKWDGVNVMVGMLWCVIVEVGWCKCHGGNVVVCHCGSGMV